MTDARFIIRRDGKAVAVVSEPLAWFHRTHGGFSMDHALRYEGYSIDSPEPWDDETAAKESRNARGYLYGDEFHNSGGCIREGRLGRENCAQCCLMGYEPRGGFGDGFSVVRDGPNVAGWCRDYVRANLPIPRYWETAFLAALDPDYGNDSYSSALARDIATWGVRWTCRTWHGQKPETLALPVIG